MQNHKLSWTRTQSEINNEHSSRTQTIVMSELKKENSLPENIPITNIFDMSNEYTKNQSKSMTEKIVFATTMFYMSLFINLAMIIIYYQKNLYLYIYLVITVFGIERTAYQNQGELILAIRNTLFFLDPIVQKNTKFFVIHSFVVAIPSCLIQSHGIFILEEIQLLYLPLLILNIFVLSTSLTTLHLIISKKVKSTNFSILRLIFQTITYIIEQVSLITQFIVIYQVCIVDEKYSMPTIIYWYVFISCLGFVGTVSITCVLQITNQIFLYILFSLMVICVSILRYIFGVRIFEKTIINEDFDLKVQSFLSNDKETYIFLFDQYFYQVSRIIQICIFFGLFLREYENYLSIKIISFVFNSLLLIYCLVSLIIQQKNKYKVYITDT